MNFSCIRVYQNWRKIKLVIFPKVQVPGPIKFCQIYQSTNQNKQKINCRACSDDPFSEWGTVICYLESLLYHYLHPFGTFLVTSDRAGRAGSHQKVTWHWAFSSIPKRITSSKHLATVISVEAKKMKSYCPPPSPPDFSKNHYCSNAHTAVAGGEGGGQEKAKNGYFKMPIFLRGSGKPLYFKENDSNKSPRRR